MLELLPYLVPGVAGIGSAVSSIRFIREDERGVILRWGKVVRYRFGKRKGQVKIVGAGFRFMIPVADRLLRTHVRQRTVSLPEQTIMLADDTVFNVTALLLCRVGDHDDDVYRALLEVVDLDEAIEDYAMAALRQVVKGKEHRAIASEESIADELLSSVHEQLGAWGVEVTLFGLTQWAPNAASARLIQTRAVAEAKVKALVEAAESLGVPVGELDPTLAAVLVDVPLVATVGGGPAPAAPTSAGEEDDIDEFDDR